jgi:phosphoribosylanthranilate isomerase
LVKVKFCGFTKAIDVENACQLNPDFIGVVVGIPESPRNLDLDRARELLQKIPANIQRVCVTRMKSLTEGYKLVEYLRPDYLQIHPDFPPEEMSKLKERAGLIIVFSVPPDCHDASYIVKSVKLYEKIADIILLDTKGPTGGGTGIPHDWRVSAEIRKRVKTPVFLAGGLNPTNVRDAIKVVQPDGVDVSSGIEDAPGQKSLEKMRSFLQAVRNMWR